ncbi:MAG: hypothetical protein MUE44_00305 [Oscillatoriaceae cyanobacterium Prado104]|nr:hypothetical protein [Oscillatoriaceae cyanobacterium Prado104]
MNQWIILPVLGTVDRFSIWDLGFSIGNYSIWDLSFSIADYSIWDLRLKIMRFLIWETAFDAVGEALEKGRTRREESERST